MIAQTNKPNRGEHHVAFRTLVGIRLLGVGELGRDGVAAARRVEMSGFADVDGAGDSSRFVQYLKNLNGTDGITTGKRERVQSLGLRAGSSAIDVGCGLGDDARAMARVVGRAGRVVGLDASSALLQRARARTSMQDEAVDYVLGDAHSLPFEARTFDAARTERTLQHLGDPGRAVQELARVTRPGGVVMATEPDWGTLALPGEPRALVRALLAAVEARIGNAWIGRELPALFGDADIAEVTVTAEAVVVGEFDAVRAVLDLPALIAEVRDLDRPGVRELLVQLEHDCRAGRAVVAMLLFSVTGRVA
jgi:SAM-dependent methyltransferase